MKKNGFMIYELVISFALAFAILLIIFNTTMSLNQKLSNLYVKNKVTSQQILFNKKINSDFTKYYISSIVKNSSSCTISYCYTITYKDSKNNLIVKKLNLNTEGTQYIEYGLDGELEKIKLNENASIEINNQIFSVNSLTGTTVYDKILKLSIPIKYLDDEKNYGIELYYLYNDTNNPLTIS